LATEKISNFFDCDK